MDFKQFEKAFSPEKLLFNEPMAKYTSFRIGGPADLIVMPGSEADIRQAVLLCRELGQRFFIMGKGSNLLVGDKGLRGVVILIGKAMESAVLIDEGTIKAQAGITLAKLAGFALENSLAGLEFASGIPGSLGGAIFMNAGAYGGEMKDVIKTVNLMGYDGHEAVVENAGMNFGYRSSMVQKSSYIITGCTLVLDKAGPDAIKEKMLDFNNRRKEKQPLDLPSGGSTFKRPQGHYAAKLIDDAGLRGLSVGGAMVSDKHCGFIVNHNNATAQDVLNLIEQVREKVYNKYKIELEPEIRIIGE